MSKDEYAKIRTPLSISRKFIFVYLLGNPTDLSLKEVYNLARKKRLEVIYVASQGQYDKYPKTWATIGEWISYINNAEFVITNSFHCTVFSLIHETPFAAVPLVGEFKRMNTRINGLLNECNLKDRIYNHNLESIFDRTMSFVAFKQYRLNLVNFSSNKLLDCLK